MAQYIYFHGFVSGLIFTSTKPLFHMEMEKKTLFTCTVPFGTQAMAMKSRSFHVKGIRIVVKKVVVLRT